MAESEDWLVPPAREPHAADDPFIGMDATAKDFWRFAMGDLRMNNARGYLAEFIVGKALGLKDVHRMEWDAYDLLWNEISIEVKSSAYLQLWEQEKLSTISFSGLKGLRWFPREGNDPEGRRYNAMVYVFSVQNAQSHEEYDPMNLAQWSFYVIPRSTLADLGQTTIGINSVKRLADGETAFRDLADAVLRASDGQRLDSDEIT